MPTKSINLKMVLPRSDLGKELRESLWVTHSEMNRAISCLESRMLLMRGMSYTTLNKDDEETVINASQVQVEALKMANRAIERNLEREPEDDFEKPDDNEMLQLLRKLYELLVPSAMLDKNGTPQSGDAASISSGYSRPLMSTTSEGGQSAFKKYLDPPPTWVQMFDDDAPEWKEASEQWLESEQCASIQKLPGRKPAWINKAKNRQDWQEAFIKYQQEQKEKVTKGSSFLIKKMKDCKLLPLFWAPLSAHMPDTNTEVTRWDQGYATTSSPLWYFFSR